MSKKKKKGFIETFKERWNSSGKFSDITFAGGLIQAILNVLKNIFLNHVIS